jgi:hypothetical protein
LARPCRQPDERAPFGANPAAPSSLVDGDILFVYALDEDRAAEMEDRSALHISIVATDILKRKIAIVLVLPKCRLGAG